MLDVKDVSRDFHHIRNLVFLCIYFTTSMTTYIGKSPIRFIRVSNYCHGNDKWLNHVKISTPMYIKQFIRDFVCMLSGVRN